MQLAFAGTPVFSVPALKALLDSKHDVSLVLTQPDRPAGRGRKLTPSPVKQVAEQANIPIFQPANLKSDEDWRTLQLYSFDLMIVVAYGQILQQRVLEYPRYGCINIHASLLPRWRGAAPIHRAVEAGDAETGISLMQMDTGLDTGDILSQQAMPISESDTTGSMHDKLSELGANMLIELLDSVKTGNLDPRGQDPNLVTYAKKLNCEDSTIDWSKDAETIHRKIRAMNPWPGVKVEHEGKSIRLWQADVIKDLTGNPGKVINIEKSGIDIACGKNGIRLKKLQKQGSKPMDVTDFLNGYSVKIDDEFKA